MEFGLILPVFLILLIAVIEYGWYFTHEIVLTNSVAEGARRAIKESEDSDAEAAAREAVNDAFWLQDLEKDGNIEELVKVEIPDEEEPKRIKVSIAAMEHKQLTGFLPSKIVPNVIGARSVMTFP